MAEIKKGILGGFSGTVGTVVGSNWRGKDLIRSRPKKSGSKPTALQMEQRVKFAAAVSFLNPLKEIQSRYYGSNAGARSRVNLAVSYTIREAMLLNDGVPELIFTKVQITKGEVTGFQNLQLALGTGNVLEFTWEDNSAQANANATDVFSSACYCPDLKQWQVTDGPEARDALAAVHNLPAAFAGHEVHVYAFLHNAGATAACNSAYVGTVTVP